MNIMWKMIVIALDAKTEQSIAAAMRSDARKDAKRHQMMEWACARGYNTRRSHLDLPSPVATRLIAQGAFPGVDRQYLRHVFGARYHG